MFPTYNFLAKRKFLAERHRSGVRDLRGAPLRTVRKAERPAMDVALTAGHAGSRKDERGVFDGEQDQVG